MASSDRRLQAAGDTAWEGATQAMYRAAQAVAHPGGPTLFDEMVRTLADILPAAAVFIAVFSDVSRTGLRTLAAVLDGKPLRNFDYPLEGSPCAQVVGKDFRYVAQGVAVEFAPGTVFGAKGMDAYAAFPLSDRSDTPLGLLVAMDRRPIADAAMAEALLKIFAGRIVAEIERGRADEALRAAALAVSSAQGETVFPELTRYLATILHVELAFVARHEPASVPDMRMLSVHCDGEWLPESAYPLQTSPCAHVLGQQFRAYPARLREQFPDDRDAEALGLESYAGFPLTGRNGAALGTIGVASRQPLAQLERVEAMLQIFAVRAAAEIEQLQAREALARSEASYRAIFESAEDAIFIHDWDTGEVIDVNPKACTTYGYSREELGRISMADISSGVSPYTAEKALANIQLAKLDRCPPFEWQRRNKDGSLHWDEVRLKPVQIDGKPHVLAFTRDITEHKAALAALQAREEQYRAIFDGSSDALGLWSRDIRLVDINRAFTQMYGYAREDVIGRGFGQQLSHEDVARRVAMIQDALAGKEGLLETHSRRKSGERFEVELRYLPIAYRGESHALVVGRDITERRERERALHRSEAQYRAIFNASADALVLRAADFSIVDVNATYEQMSGYQRDEVLGVDRVLANPPEAGETIRALHARALAGEPIALRTQLVRRDGRRYELELRGVPVEHSGRPHVLYIGRDITQAMQAERALRASEEQYRAIFNASADVLTLWNSQYRRVDVNPAYERLYGWTREEVIGRGFEFPPYSQAHRRQREELLRRGLAGETVQTEHDVVTKSGERRLAEVRAIPFRHEGEPHVLAITRDITERNRAELALRTSEEQYRAIFNASADALVLRDAEFRAVEVNPAFVALSGYAREEVLHSDLVLASDEPERPATHRELHARVLAGEVLRFERTVRRKKGERRQVEVRGTPVTYRGQPHVLYAVRDMTERHEAERQRAELERQLRQSQKMEAIGQLTGGIAHDFNNILTSVMGYLVLGQERAEALADATLQRQLGQAQLAAQRARDLIAQLLAFARRQRGERRVLALAPLVRQSLQLLRSTLPASVVLDGPDLDVDAEEATSPVHADVVQIEQLLFNLCINARDAIGGSGQIRVNLRERDGGAWRCASCGCSGSGPWVELSVADSGGGITPEVMERMFDPFFTTKEVGHGSGMGLAMVHGIVHDHRGHVLVDTQAGRGTTFRILLPAATAPAVAMVSSRPVGWGRRPVVLAGRVLLVEDEVMVGDFLAELLQGWGLQVVLMRDPRAALLWLEDPSNALDLMITDQTMPQMTGLALARRAGELRPGLPVMLYTGQADAIEAAELQQHAVRALLRKPVDADALHRILQDWLGTPHR